MDHALELQETVSLSWGSLHATPTPPHYLSLGTPRNVIEQLVIGRSQTTATDNENNIHISLQNISQSISEWVLMELLTFEDWFKLKYDKSVGRTSFVSTLPIAETYKADTPTKETKKINSVITTIFSESRSAFMEP